MLGCLAVVAVVLLGPRLIWAPAGAEESGLKALRTGDDSRGWEAVGRIDLGGRAFCTGALVAPDQVLTAAHCLFDKVTGEPFKAEDMEFLAGWRDGRAEAYRKIRRALPHPDYVFGKQADISRVGNDLALLQLEHPIRLPSIQPFDTDLQPRRGDAVGVVSYALDRAEAPSLQELCHVLDRQGAVLVTSCSVDFGASGSPIFSMQDGVPRIVSVVSAKAEMGGKPVSLGTALAGPLTELRAQLTGALHPMVGQVIRKGAGEAGVPGSAGGGAKFLRP